MIRVVDSNIVDRTPLFTMTVITTESKRVKVDKPQLMLFNRTNKEFFAFNAPNHYLDGRICLGSEGTTLLSQPYTDIGSAITTVLTQYFASMNNADLSNVDMIKLWKVNKHGVVKGAYKDNPHALITNTELGRLIKQFIT
jgi:hypothetical protein